RLLRAAPPDDLYRRAGSRQTREPVQDSVMSWDKRATVRRVSDPPPKRSAGLYIVYLGLTEKAARRREPEPSSLQVGDVFRLLPGKAITIGRGKLCEVTVESDSVSTAHALLSFMPGAETRLALVD